MINYCGYHHFYDTRWSEVSIVESIFSGEDHKLRLQEEVDPKLFVTRRSDDLSILAEIHGN